MPVYQVAVNVAVREVRCLEARAVIHIEAHDSASAECAANKAVKLQLFGDGLDYEETGDYKLIDSSIEEVNAAGAILVASAGTVPDLRAVPTPGGGIDVEEVPYEET